MFYVQGAAGYLPVNLTKWKKDETAVGYLTMEEAERHRERLQIPLEVIEQLAREPVRFGGGLRMKEKGACGLLYLLPEGQQAAYGRLAVFVRQNLFVLVEVSEGQERWKEQLLGILEGQSEEATLERVVYEYLDHFLQQGNHWLGQLEARILTMEHSLVEGAMDRNLNRDIFRLKCRLSMLKNYFGQFASIGALLRENENHMFWQEDFEYFKVFTDKAERLLGNTKMLCEDLIHVREALDAALDYNLNSIMKVFTVVTTVFLPLSLITGWYGMNFAHMPELTWRYGYIGVALLALAVVAACIFFFKWKKLL